MRTGLIVLIRRIHAPCCFLPCYAGGIADRLADGQDRIGWSFDVLYGCEWGVYFHSSTTAPPTLTSPIWYRYGNDSFACESPTSPHLIISVDSTALETSNNTTPRHRRNRSHPTPPPECHRYKAYALANGTKYNGQGLGQRKKLGASGLIGT
jgi:hypothetical protein